VQIHFRYPMRYHDGYHIDNFFEQLAFSVCYCCTRWRYDRCKVGSATPCSRSLLFCGLRCPAFRFGGPLAQLRDRLGVKSLHPRAIGGPTFGGVQKGLGHVREI